MSEYIHRINGIIGKSSLSVILPIKILKELKIVKGDYVGINQSDDHIVITKLEVQNNE